MAADEPSPARPGVPERTCPHCGVTSATRYEQCPACGRSYFERPSRLGDGARRGLLIGGGILALAVVVVAGLLLAQGKRDKDARAAAQTAKLVAAEKRRLTKLQAPHDGAAPALRDPVGASDTQRLAVRRRLVVRVQGAIATDARARIAAGEIQGPVLRTTCGPVLRAPDAVPDDRILTKAIGRYDCLAVRREVPGKDKALAELGYPFVTAIDFTRGRWTFCRNTPAQSERGAALAQVRLDRRCLAAKGRAVGSGYAESEDDG